MIVKILSPPRDPGKPFDGVRYNTEKVMREKGELMLVRNFGAMEGLSKPRPQDYINYLEAWSARSTRIRYPQFHVALSAKGREMDKHQLCELAEAWLAGMGYGDNPYLLIFHKDTLNNHLHIVTSRIGPDGKKIDDSYERKRAYLVLNRLLNVVPKDDVARAIDQAMQYDFATRAQFMLLLEARGYSLKPDQAYYQVFKYGKRVAEIPLAQVDQRISAYQADEQRLRQLRAMVSKYRQLYSPVLYPVHEPLAGGGQGKVTGHASELTDHLRQYGLQFIFHGKEGKPPYGYTLIDHTRKTVYKGGLLMPLAELVARPTDERKKEATGFDSVPARGSDHPFERAVEIAPELTFEVTLTEPVALPGPEIYVPPLRIDIAGDIDDEQILGRNRRRKRKARTNAR